MTTKQEQYRASVTDEIAELGATLASSRQELTQLEKRRKSLKAEIDEDEANLFVLVDNLRQIENGTYQPPLFDKKDLDPKGPEPEDPAKSASLEVLANHGLTARQVELLGESELASQEDIVTVSDLERVIRQDRLNASKIKGFGPEAIDKLSDALVDYRKSYPVPVPDENRTVDDIETVVLTLPGPNRVAISVGTGEDGCFYADAIFDFGAGNKGSDIPEIGSETTVCGDTAEEASRGVVDQLLFEARQAPLEADDRQRLIDALMEHRQKWCDDE